MKQKLGVIAAALASGAMALPAAAQSQASYPYRNEVSVFGTWEEFSEPEDVERSVINLRYGRFVRPQLLGTFTLQRESAEGSGLDFTTTSWLVGAKYYFSQPRAQAMVPFVDAGIGMATIDTGSDDDTELTWEIGGGVSWFFSQATSFDAGLRFFHTDTDIETKGTRIFVGITTRF